VKQPDSDIKIKVTKNRICYSNYSEQCCILSCHWNRKQITHKTAKIASPNSKSFPDSRLFQ